MPESDVCDRALRHVVVRDRLLLTVPRERTEGVETSHKVRPQARLRAKPCFEVFCLFDYGTTIIYKQGKL